MRHSTNVWIAVAMACLGCGQLEQARPEGVDAEETGDESEATTSGSSSGDPDAADDTTGGDTTSTTDEPNDADTDAEASESGSDDTAGEGERKSCWNEDPTAWQVDALDTSQLLGEKIGGAALSGDGLSLAYVAMSNMGNTGYIAVRDGLSEPFVGGEVIAPWATDTVDAGGFRFASGPDRLGLLLDGDVHTSSYDGDNWEAPVPLAFEMPIDVLVSPPHFFGDTLAVMVDIGDGPLVGGNPTQIAYEARREDLSSPMGDRTRISMPGWPDDTPLLCAVPSPDGEFIVFGGAFPSVWSDPEDSLASALDIWFSQRDDDETWAAPVEVDALSHASLLSCPTSVTDDGCLLTVRHFEIGVGTQAISIARR